MFAAENRVLIPPAVLGGAISMSFFFYFRLPHFSIDSPREGAKSKQASPSSSCLLSLARARGWTVYGQMPVISYITLLSYCPILFIYTNSITTKSNQTAPPPILTSDPQPAGPHSPLSTLHLLLYSKYHHLVYSTLFYSSSHPNYILLSTHLSFFCPKIYSSFIHSL